jgi:PAS domain S-box-containing protein
VRRRQTASRKPAKAQQAVESKRGSALKAARNRRSSASSDDKELARLARERDDALEQLRLVVDTIPTLVWSCRPDGAFDYVNRRWSEYTGISAQDALGSGWMAAYHPDDVVKHQEIRLASLVSGEPVMNEVRLRRADGHYRWHLIHGVPLRDALGKILKWYGAAADIEDRKRTEEALQRSEAYLAEAQRLSHTGSWAIDYANRKPIHSSEEHHRLFGFDPAGGMPPWRDWMQRIHPEDRAMTRQIIERSSGERTGFEMDYRICHPVGTIKYLHVVGHPILNAAGDVIEFVGTSIDVTERRQAEESRQQRDAKIRRLVESNIIGIYFWEAEGRILDANDEFLRIVGYDREDLVADRLNWIEISPQEWRERIPAQLTELRRTRVVRPYEKDYIRKDGARVTVLIYDSSFDETARLGVCFTLDLTERKRAEEELRAMQAQLARANRLATMGQLTASIAHEVTQPVAATVTNAQAALRWLNGPTPGLEEARQALERIVKDGNRAGQVIDRVRALIKKAPPRKDHVEINGAIREVIELSRGETAKNGISVRTELAARLPVVQGDRVELQQVILNLIINAVEAMSGDREGPRELRVSSREAESGGVLVAVSDSGPGLAFASLDRLFEAFYTTKPSGLGLGLSICRSIIQAHGGRLWASTSLPRGAIFQFTLPVEWDRAL